uniref:DOD-type homing endonuclease domain-containing protein n=1 Tax=Globisporangium ultimum (strain ATCC 200006 / CBS 805.95 / DAOM BR144) TaxID=431595 RepID=K3X899_GLOUD
MGWRAWRFAAMLAVITLQAAIAADADVHARPEASTEKETDEATSLNDHRATTEGVISWDIDANERSAGEKWAQDASTPGIDSFFEKPTHEVQPTQAAAEGDALTSGKLADEQMDAQKLQAALESIFSQLQTGDQSLSLGLDASVMNQLQELEGENAAPMDAETAAASFKQEKLVKEIRDKEILGFQQLADKILDEWETADAKDNAGAATENVKADVAELTDEFLDLEKRIETEGYAEELISQLHVLASEQNDLYAKETLAYMELFEPVVATRSNNWTEAFANLRSAVDAGIESAISTLALLNLVDFGVARNASLTQEQRHNAAQSALMELAAKDEFVSSLAMGYRFLSGKMKKINFTPNALNGCTNAVMYYHRCAQSNIHTLLDQGGEKPDDGKSLTRLSDEWMLGSSAAHDELHEDAAQRFEYYRTLAGNPADPQWAEATEHLGETYFYGDEAAGIVQDQAVAAQHFQRAADAGDAHAQANFGMMLLNGVGVPQNNASALRYFSVAAEQGSAFAHYGLGAMYMSGSGVSKNATKAVKYFEKAVELGYNEAHTYLGSAYLNGQGVPINKTRAFEHFELAAETESSQALFNVAVMYYRGIGTPRSCERAVHYFRTVALHPAILSDLPFSMAKGYECFQKGDYVRAFLNYRLAGELGDEHAQINAAFLLEKFGHKIFPTKVENEGDATKDEAEAAEASLPATIPWMGTTKLPLEEAYKLYSQAALLNDTEAIRKTGLCFHDDEWGSVCERNHSIALTRYALAAELGDPEAAYNCGLMYAMGDGIEQSLDMAKKYYAQCSETAFPDNVPCAIALMALDVVLMLRSVGQALLAFGGSYVVN